MKKFLKNISIFGIVLLLITIAIECLLLKRPNSYSYKRMYVEEHINDIKCLLLGNSHIEESLNANLMGSGVFNLAISGRKIIYDIELAKNYVPNMNSIETIIMPLDYTEFYFGREHHNQNEQRDRNPRLDDTYKCMYYKYMGIRIDGFWYWSEFLNSTLDFMKRFVQNEEEAIGCDSLGYVKLELSKRKSNWNYLNLPKIIDTTLPKDQSKEVTLYMQYRTLAEIARTQGARLVLLITPMYETYIQSMNPTVVEEMNRFVTQLEHEFSNVEFYDYSSDKRFIDDDFYDASHLTSIGATKFSKIVKEEVLNKKIHQAGSEVTSILAH